MWIRDVTNPQCEPNPVDCRITEPVSVQLFSGLGVITGGSAFDLYSGTDTRGRCVALIHRQQLKRKHTQKHEYTHAYTHMHTLRGSVYVSQRDNCFIRANFIQLLSENTPREKHIQAHTYASPPGLGEIIVYLHKCSAKKNSSLCKNLTIIKLFSFRGDNACQRTHRAKAEVPVIVQLF